jgi:hypothetical protein
MSTISRDKTRIPEALGKLVGPGRRYDGLDGGVVPADAAGGLLATGADTTRRNRDPTGVCSGPAREKLGSVPGWGCR